MADPLSAISAISGLLLASVKVTKEIYKFRQGFREAPDDVKQLCDSLESIQSILQQLQDALKPDASADRMLPDGVHADLMKMIQNCNGIYDRLLKLTKEYGRRAKGWDRTRWVMVGQGEAAKLGEMLVTHKLTLSITLQWTNHITLMAMKQEMRDGFQDVRHDTEHILDVMKDQCASLKDVCAKLDAQSLADVDVIVPRVADFLESASFYTAGHIQYMPAAQPPPYTKVTAAFSQSQAECPAPQMSGKGKEKDHPPSRALIRRGSSFVQHTPKRAKQKEASLVTVHQETDELRSLVDPMAMLWSNIEHLPEPFDRVLSSLKWRSDRLEAFQRNTTKQNPIHVPTEYARHCGSAMQHLSVALNSFMILGASQPPIQTPFVFSLEVQQAPHILQNLMATLHNDAMMLKYSGLELKEGHIFDDDLAPVFSQHCRTAKDGLGLVNGMLQPEETRSMKRWRNVTTVLKKKDIEEILRALHDAEAALEMAVRSYPIYSEGSERPDFSTLILQPWRSNLEGPTLFEKSASPDQRESNED